LPRIWTNTWFFGLVCILLTLSLIGYTVHLQKKIILEESQSNTLNLLNSVEKDLERSFAGLEQIFSGLENYLAQSPSENRIDPPAVRRVIDNIILANPYLSALLIVDGNGQVLHWNNNFEKPNISDRHYFHIHQEGLFEGLFIGLPQQSLVNQEQWIFGISKAVRHSDHSLSLVLAAIVDLNYFYRQYHTLFNFPGVTLTISSPSGRIYSRVPGRREAIGQQAPEFAIENGGSHEGTQHFSMTRKVNNYPLLLTVTKEKSTVLKPWRNSALSFVFLGFGICAALLFMTYRTALFQKQQMQIKEELSRQAMTDPLTELLNRRRVLELARLEIKKSVRNNMPLSIILLDLDHFKNINDQFGHQQGDDVLEGTAGVLRDYSRESDILSRFGGEEFLLLLPDTDLQGAMVVAQKIRDGLKKKVYSHPKGDFHVTASIGVSQWTPKEKDINDALQRADTALYSVKTSGRDNVRWMPSNLGELDAADTIIWLPPKSGLN